MLKCVFSFHGSGRTHVPVPMDAVLGNDIVWEITLYILMSLNETVFELINGTLVSQRVDAALYVRT